MAIAIAYVAKMVNDAAQLKCVMFPLHWDQMYVYKLIWAKKHATNNLEVACTHPYVSVSTMLHVPFVWVR